MLMALNKVPEELEFESEVEFAEVVALAVVLEEVSRYR